MANQQHLEILMKGVEAWNRWRVQNPETRPDLSEADLSEADLHLADLSGANLSEANLSWAILSAANLSEADLSEADLHLADLSGANLLRANLVEAKLIEANLSGANLSGADLSEADLGGAILSAADLKDSVMKYTLVVDLDLSVAKWLETVKHVGPSTVGIDTIYRSQGNIPEIFLRGAGVPENFIAYMKSLAGTPEAFEYYSSFISYSTKDQKFADLLHSQLQSKGARVWLATEDLKIGDKFRAKIDEAIRLFDKLLLVLSKDSVKSTWVEAEVEAAFEKERKQGRPVLFPIRLDDAVIEADEAWAANIRRTRHIGDFRKWKDHDEYQKAFARLMRDLEAEEKGPD